ncbi:hypothetical protein ABLE68_18120 [Nocardioides sp. CN2-186]|uniref:hypothetical protein n=1 Tax=Nocardioides tweenelious TaxID=3156607 RepID=UPI0032B51240
MARRVSLPAADDLFRPTAPAEAEQPGPRAVPDAQPEDVQSDAAPTAEDTGGRKKPSGRVRHDEKMTVYVTSDELLDIEHARLGLRRAQGLAVDRGRLVREAIAMVLADYEANGDDSALVRRLTEG